jgi:hypothetical protein
VRRHVKKHGGGKNKGLCNEKQFINKEYQNEIFLKVGKTWSTKLIKKMKRIEGSQDKQ